MRLLDVFEAVEGGFRPTDCLLPRRICSGRSCVFGDLVVSLNDRVLDYMRSTRISDLAEVYASPE